MRVIKACALVLFSWSLTACQGDSLYDSDDPAATVPPPQVEIRSPLTGQQITAGRPVGIQVFASDTLGITRIEVLYRGVTTGNIVFDIVPPRETVVVDTVIVLPASQTGNLELRATSTNGLGGVGNATVIVLPVALRDSITPGITLTVQTPPRMELTDSIRARITATDNVGGTGIVRVGLTALVTSSLSATTDTMVFERVVDLGTPQTGTVVRDIVFAPPFVDARNLPNTLQFQFHAFAVDSAGNCAAAVTTSNARFSCGTFRNATVASGIAPSIPTTVVSGRSVALPAGSRIPDAAVDVARERLYLSNLPLSRLEVMDLRTLTFGAPVTVGSQPWGVHMNRSADTLIVANSGGTSLSYVTLQGAPREIVGARIHTPNVNIFEIKFNRDNNGVQRLSVVFHDFSDRPQYVAQDNVGRLLYSTLPTTAAPNGTMRVADKQAGWAQAEVKLLTGRKLTQPDSFTVTVLNVDSMRVFTGTGGDAIEIYDHVSGFPGQIIRSGIRSMNGALDSLTVDPRSDIVWVAGRIDRTLVGLSDTTYVAASGDRRRVGFAEGARGSGRIFIWEAAVSEISNEITVADLVGNTAEHIVGIDMNHDGTLNTARGLSSAYYFKEDLRLQGHFAAVAFPGGSGAGLHPGHPSYTNFPPSGPNTLGYVATGQTVKIVDTVHFNERGEIPVRDNIVGPLKVSRPLPSDNAGCSGADCIVARLYGVTDGNAVVLVEVRGRDIR
jgi:hypothetical protein